MVKKIPDLAALRKKNLKKLTLEELILLNDQGRLIASATAEFKCGIPGMTEITLTGRAKNGRELGDVRIFSAEPDLGNLGQVLQVAAMACGDKEKRSVERGSPKSDSRRSRGLTKRTNHGSDQN